MIMRTLFTIILIAFVTHNLFALDRYWIATAPSAWNNPASWSASTGGGTCNCIPAAGDRVFFNGGTDGSLDGNVTLTTDVSILALNVSTAYNGSIDLGGFQLNAGGTTTNITSTLSNAVINNGMLRFSNTTTNSNTIFDGGVLGVNVIVNTRSFTVMNGVIFNGTFSATVGNPHLDGATFNSTTDIVRTTGLNAGSPGNNQAGGNVFNGITRIVSGVNNTLPLNMGVNAGDSFNGQLTLVAGSGLSIINLGVGNGTGDIEVTTLTGNLILERTSGGASSTQHVSLGNTGGGLVRFSGASSTITRQYNLPNTLFANVEMNKNNGAALTMVSGSWPIVDGPINITGMLNFVSGVLNTTATNFFDFQDNAVATGASDACYIDGPVRKTGNDAFIFPVGNNGIYRPISISAPADVLNHFTARFFSADPLAANGTNKVASLTTVSGCEYWGLTRCAAGCGTPSDVYITLGWDVADCPDYSITDLNALSVARWSGTQWADEGNNLSPGGTPAAGTVTSFQAVSAFNIFALATSGMANTLPVTLYSFEAEKINDHTVELTFKTSSELNNDRFEIEKSTEPNTSQFNRIGTVAGKGTTNELSVYRFTDYDFSGSSYYRLKQIDMDGDYAYSQVVYAESNGQRRKLIVSPNPFSYSVDITVENESTDSNLRMNLINTAGQIIRSYFGTIEAVTENFNADIGMIKPGCYFITVATSSGAYQTKVFRK